jgi:hypothetical protein
MSVTLESVVYVNPPTIKSSPWGAVQHQQREASGIDFVSTAGHGGLKLNREMNAKIPKLFRRPSGWYEEDCESLIVMYFLSDLKEQWKIKKEEVLKHLKNWFWEEWEFYSGTTLAPGESKIKDQEMWARENNNRFIVVSAMTSSKDRNFVECFAKRNQDSAEGWFIVPANEYKIPFAIDEAKHPRKATPGFSYYEK